MEFEFDPYKTSYDALLNLFWEQHSPYHQTSHQYRSAIFYHNDRQKILAEQSKKNRESAVGRNLYTTISPMAETSFTLAEDYHQKYQLQRYPSLFKAFKFKSDLEMINSSAASRVNGYVGGNGTYEDLLKELPSYGLDSKAQSLLKEIVESRSGSSSCRIYK